MGHSKAAAETWGQTGAGRGAETNAGGGARGKNVLLESGQKRSQRSREAAGGQKSRRHGIITALRLASPAGVTA